MRIAISLLVVAACSKGSSNKSAESDRGTGEGVGAGNVGGAPQQPRAGSGSITPSEPAQEMKVAAATSEIITQQARVAQGTDGDAGVPTAELQAVNLGSGSGGKAPPGKIAIASKTSFDHTNLSADAVADRIVREHLASLGTCYRTALARDASVKGKARLDLTVKPDGTVVGAKANAPDTTLQGCFTQTMQTWVFPIPKDADGEATEAGFSIVLALAPE